jgi:hypothetical protein
MVESDVARFCGLALRRLQDIGVPGELENDKTNVTVADLNSIFAEGLSQFSKATAPEEQASD